MKKKHIESHVSPSKFGMGDSYGSGIKQKMGKMVAGSGINPLKPKKLLKPPKSLA